MHRLLLSCTGSARLLLGLGILLTTGATFGQQLNIKCGGSAYTAMDGTKWVADEYFTGGENYYTGSSFAGTSDFYLYRTSRMGLYTDFSYQIPIANGTYQVTLLFAESQYGGKGQRIFNVVMNGSTVLSNFDILTQVPFATTLNKQFQTTVSNGLLNISFIGIVERGIVSGIQIAPAATQVTSSSTVSNSSQPAISIDAGGSALVTSDGTHWIADQYFTGGQTYWTGGSFAGVSPNDLSLYRSAREGLYSDFSYLIPLANGPYKVTLLFGESTYSGVGQRIFNVVMNGTIVLWNFDILRHVPILTPYTQQFETSVTNGTLEIDFIGVMRRGIINGIQITPAAAGTQPSPPANPLTLGVSQNSFTFSATAGGANPSAQPLSITASGPGTLNWTATKNQSWLTLSQASGSGAASLNVGVNTSGLKAGNYSDTITITAAGAAGSPQTISVNLTVNPAPTPMTLGVSPNSLSFSGTAGGANPPSDPISITGTGSGTLNWTASKTQPWLTLSQGSGSGSSAFSASVNLGGMKAGTYTDTIMVAASGATGSPGQIGVTLNVAAAPTSLTLNVSQTSMAFAGTAGGNSPAAQNLNITASGPGTLNWTVTKTQSWLTVSPASGSGSASLSVSANISGLKAGSYSDTITITAPGAVGSPRQVSVTFGVTPASTSGGRQWYVSPTGSSSGNGSISNPWDIVTGFAAVSIVQPGDTVWVRGGTYSKGYYIPIRLVGTAAQPIIIRNYPGERAIISSWLQVGCCDQNPQPSLGAYVWVWGLEFWNPATDRTGSTTNADSPQTPSIDTWAVGTKIINNVIHDTSGGPGVWKEAQNSEVFGNVIYFNGWEGPDRAHGHGLYTQNLNGTMLISDNFSFDNFDEGMQFYGSGVNGYIRNYNVVGNTLFENGQISGGLNQSFLFAGGVGGVNNINVTNNYVYDPPGVSQGYTAFGFPWDTMNGSISITNNVFADGYDATDFWHWTSIVFQNNQVYSPVNEMLIVTAYPSGYSGYSMDNNTYWGGGRFTLGQGGPAIVSSTLPFSTWQSVTGEDAHSTYYSAPPSGVWSYVRPNKYETGRANIVIYNWSLQGSVNVDVSGVLSAGTSYQVRDVQNYFGTPVASGVYQGGTITIPMTNSTIERPQGNVPVVPAHTSSQFGAFVLLPQ